MELNSSETRLLRAQPHLLESAAKKSNAMQMSCRTIQIKIKCKLRLTLFGKSAV